LAETKAEKFEREYESEARREWVAALPCCACGRGPCENHHTRSDGKSRRGPASVIVPLCKYPHGTKPGCHERLHTAGKLSMEQAVNRDRGGFTFWGETYQTFAEVAEAVHAEWTSNEEGLAL